MRDNVTAGQVKRAIGREAWSARRAGELMSAAIDGQLERVDRLAAMGASLSGLTSREAACFFVEFVHRRLLTDDDSNGDPREFWTLKGSALAKAKLAHDAKLGAQKKAIWLRLIELGMPLANFDDAATAGDELVAGGSSSRCVPSAAWPMAIEAARGGFLARSAFSHWAWLDMAVGDDPRGKAALVPFGGTRPLDFAASKGLPLKGLSRADFVELIKFEGDGCGIDSALATLSARGARLEGDEPLAQGYNGFAESAIGRLLHIGASPLGVQDAAKIGVGLFAVDDKGRSALETLFGLERAGRYAERAAALLDCAEAVEPGGCARLLAIRGKDGSGPMHWAARALCEKSVALLADMGADPNAGDKTGKTAGHWAARKYGAKREAKVGPTLGALTRAGQIWSAIDAKGVSALAELSAKGPLGPIGDLLDEQPEAIHAKGGGAMARSAMQALRAREGGHAEALAQKAEIKAELKPAPAAPGSKGRSMRI